MAVEITLNAKIREGKGTADARRLRRAGELPAILYGRNEPLSLKLSEVDVIKSARLGLAPNSLVHVQIESKGKGEKKTVLIKDIQRNPLTQQFLHIDFNEVDLTVKVRADIPVESVGEPKGVKEQGGILECIFHELEVECLPTDLPKVIEVDVTSLMIGDSIYVKQIVVSDKIKILNDPELTVFAVTAPKIEEEPAPAAAGEAPKEPELVDQKGKKLEEGEVAEGAAEAKEKGKEKEKEKGKEKEGKK